MKVSDLLSTKGQTIITITPDRPVFEAMKKLMDNKISSLMVLDAGYNIKGIITERDIIRAMSQDYGALKTQKVADLMTKAIIVGTPEDDIEYVMGIMTQNRIRHLPIIAEDGLTGIISIGDIVKFQLQEIEVENHYLQDFISGNYFGW
jgi:CBS domain-containing protein